MDKRYQVFVSSTYTDLKTERQQVIQALLELDCIPAGMELFPASNDDQWTLIRRVIDDCDYYIVIIGGRYGSTDDAGLSYTEKEYDYAIDQGKATMAFLHREPEKIALEKSELDSDAREKLKAFRNKATQKMAQFWSSPDDLGGKVSRSLVKLIKSHPAEGWVKARHASDAESVLRLHAEIDRLQSELRDARTKPPPNTEDLQQGNDVFTINYALVDTVVPEINPPRKATKRTWNEIIAIVGPRLLNGCSQTAIREQIESALESTMPSMLQVSINNKDLDTVLIQLRSLGVINEVAMETIDDDSYWMLTPYGDSLVTQFRALRRPKKSDDE